jgi:hypothetical protein
MSVLCVCACARVWCTLWIEIMFERQGITQKETYNIQNTAKVWNQKCLNIFSIRKVHLTHTHTHTDGTNVWPQTAQFYNERNSTHPSSVTWRSAVYEPPENGFMRVWNVEGQTSSVLVWDFSVFEVCKLCIGWNSKMVITPQVLSSSTISTNHSFTCLVLSSTRCNLKILA